MPTYHYKVKDRSGKTRTGTLEAPSERTAAAMIREAGGLPMEIRLAHGSAGEIPAAPALVRYLIHPLWTGVNINGLMFFYRQLATLLTAGMSISESLRSISERTRGPLGGILRQAHSRVQSGGRLSDELAFHPRVFAPMQVSLIRAGEETGSLEKMSDRIASYLEYEVGIRRKIVMATWYPVLILLFIELQPVLIALVIGTPRSALNILVANLRDHGLPIVVAVVAAKLLFQFDAPRHLWDTVKIVPPVFGLLARKIAMSRFSKALALLYSSGIPISRAVSISADACANLAVSRKVKSAIPALNEGHPLTDSLQKTGVLLPVVIEMMAIGEQTGSYDATLQKVADYMESEADATIHKLSILLFVLMILAAGFFVLINLVAGYSGMVNKTMGGGL